jgi:exonuclease SbcD
MKILHTADWHIGQLFHEYDRSDEHQQFLYWLTETLMEQEIDLLLVSGDVFDNANPAASSIKMFYTFLHETSKRLPHIQMIIIAGNHDSASRLEAPKPLLESSNIHIIGMLERTENHAINIEKLLIPIKNKTNDIILWCIAIPYLRMGDYATIENVSNPYTAGVVQLYQDVFQLANQKKQAGQCILAMGHLHAANVDMEGHSDKDRPIMGGVECIPANAFHEDIVYTALGHIHKAQKVSGRENVRYSGSPIPMSFSEHQYKHQVIMLEIKENKLVNMEAIEIPILVPLLRLPKQHEKLENVLDKLAKLPTKDNENKLAPYLEVRVLLDGPEPALRHLIEKAIENKQVRLAKIDVQKQQGNENITMETFDKLDTLKPNDIFSKIYLKTYNEEIPNTLQKLFQDVLEETLSKEN